MRVQIRKRYRRVLRQLPLDSEGGLDDVRSAEVRGDFLDALSRGKLAELRNRWNVGIKIRIRDHVLLLSDAVVALRCQHVLFAEAIVENAESAAQNQFWPGIVLALSRRPGESDARRPISPIMNVGLG